MPNMTIGDIDSALMTRSSEEISEHAFVAFCGSIEHTAVSQILRALTKAINDGSKHIHLLFQSNGGSVADGIALYNFFHALPVPLTIYNAGTVRSAGVMSFLGAKYRKTSQYSTFVLHRCRLQNQSGYADQMQVLADNLLIEEDRIERLLRAHLDLTSEQWANFYNYELVLTPEKAVCAQLADGIGEFSPLPHA